MIITEILHQELLLGESLLFFFFSTGIKLHCDINNLIVTPVRHWHNVISFSVLYHWSTFLEDVTNNSVFLVLCVSPMYTRVFSIGHHLTHEKLTFELVIRPFITRAISAKNWTVSSSLSHWASNVLNSDRELCHKNTGCYQGLRRQHHPTLHQKKQM